MENVQYWDRLTASLAVVELRDLEVVWGFLSHAGVIEHEKRGAFDLVIAAVTKELGRGEIVGLSPASRIAIALRALQTQKGAQLDPDAAETRIQFEMWQLSRSGSRRRIVD